MVYQIAGVPKILAKFLKINCNRERAKMLLTEI